MYHRARDLVLRWFKVPPEPHPPAGAPASLRVFRAGKNYLNLRLFGWATAQVFALAGIVFWTVVLHEAEGAARAKSEARLAAPPAAVTEEPAAPVPAKTTKSTAKTARAKSRNLTWAGFKQILAEFATRLPPWSFPLIWVIKVGGILLYVVQIPFTYAVRRLDFELRWYVVTDRSLRIRTGVLSVQELTMSFANLQHVAVTQGPLQRFLGLADVRVQSAGGGGGGSHQKGRDDALHTATFHSVENATEIRDLILDRLRLFRATGLGDPDDHHDAPVATAAPAIIVISPALAAAREMLVEARALRHALRP